MTTKKTAERTVIVPAIADSQPTPAEVLDYRTLESGNIVLVFEGAEVVMPGGWRLRKALCVGDVVAAYWGEDGRFHLEQ